MGVVLLNPQSHSLKKPHCWRHKAPVIFRATPQWFVSMQQNGLRDAVNREILKVDWIPDWGKKRIELFSKISITLALALKINCPANNSVSSKNTPRLSTGHSTGKSYCKPIA
jgi:hypothetical protein